MADVTGAKIDWADVSQPDVDAGNATALANKMTATRLNALGQAVRNVDAEVGALTPILVLDDVESVPVGTPAGTVIIRSAGA